jgi:hypothetical protein
VNLSRIASKNIWEMSRMECSRIRDKLSDYIDRELSDQEINLIEAHLRSCEECTRALADLRTAVVVTQGLGEVEPPSWLAQKVMNRVREEGGQKRGLIQKLFFPVHIKAPLEVFAAIAVVVTAFYIFRTVEPGIHQSAVAPEKGMVLQEEEAGGRTIRDGVVGAKKPAAEAPVPRKRKGIVNGPEPRSDSIETLEEHPPGAEKKAVPPTSYKALDMREQQRAGAAGTRMQEMRKLKTQTMMLTLFSKDTERAERETQRAALELGGRVTETAFFENRRSVTVHIEYNKINELMEKLKVYGEVKEVAADPGPSDGAVQVEIVISKVPERIR